MWISEILSLLCYPELCWVSVMLSVWTQMAAVSSDWVRMHASNLTTAVKVISNKTLFFSYPQIQMNEVMFMPIIQIFTKLSNDLCDVIFSCWMHVPYFIEQGFTFNSTGGKNCMDELIAIHMFIIQYVPSSLKDSKFVKLHKPKPEYFDP